MAVPLIANPAMHNEDVTLLIVDDEPRNLDALEAMLEGTGCRVVRAQSADEALLAMLREDFAAIILDIRMPGISGIDLAHLIKQRRRSQHVPILFLTAHLLDDEDVLRGYGVGAVDYLSKPVNANILRSKVAVFVELFRKTRSLAALNDVLQNEIAERQKAQEALQEANGELELRVAQRTAALSIAHRGAVESEERLRLAMEVAEIAAWHWDLATDQMEWSADPEALFGFPAGAFGPELRIFRRLHPDDVERVQAAIELAKTTGQYECEYRAVRPDRSVVWITERGRIVRGEDGTPQKVVGVSRDISAQREAAQQKEQLLLRERQARDEAERQSRLKDEFLATLSHELRTPMNAILGWLSMLASGSGVADTDHVIAVIRRNAEAQAKLIEDLLEMNKLMSGTVRLEIAPVDVSASVGGAIQALQPAADAKGVQLLTDVQPMPAEIMADHRRFQQILWNLLHNAVKFTSSGGRVMVSAAADDRCMRIVVEDTGQGIAPDFLPHVFERFRQADPSTTRGAWGLGLGLSIAKHLVELHGGDIVAASDGIGLGSMFVVRLPLNAGAERASTSPGAAPVPAPAPAVPGPGATRSVGV
jgi:PAS domain S-box-containing protein